MFFIFSKTLGFFLTPSNFLIMLVVAGLVLTFTRFQKLGRKIAMAGVALLLICGFSPLGNALILPLEDRFPPWQPGGEPPAGIIILGGALSPELSAARSAPALNEAAERLIAVAELARRYPDARIVYSGGSGNLFGGRSEADFVLPLFESFGIAPERILLEDRSRNTLENAVYAQVLVTPQPGERWLLVTSAAHMPRAIGAFRHVGFMVEAYPVDWRTRGPADLTSFFKGFAGGLGRTDTAVHEWVGLLAYRLTGTIPALLPAP